MTVDEECWLSRIEKAVDELLGNYRKVLRPDGVCLQTVEFFVIDLKAKLQRIKSSEKKDENAQDRADCRAGR